MKSKCKKCKHCSFFQVIQCPPNGDLVLLVYCEKYNKKYEYFISDCLGYEKNRRLHNMLRRTE